jgi:metal-sulfur cluster biosynthetic enzyme
MKDAPTLSAQLAEVWARLDLVMDPELDEAVTDMGFIEAVTITGPATVEIAFRLPTYWCSPNFAFLMATDIKREVESLAWVARAIVRLEDHNSGAELNEVVNAGGKFAEVFPDLPEGENLSALREKFDQKAFQRRQEVVIKALVALGHAPAAIVDLTLAELDAQHFADPEDARQKTRYRDLLVAKDLARAPAHKALPTWAGDAITAEGFREYMGLLRSVRINMEFSGSLCRGLKASRYKEADMSAGGVPVLVDFIDAPTAGHSR